MNESTPNLKEPNRPPAVMISTLLLAVFSLIWLVVVIALPPRARSLFFAAQASLVWAAFSGLLFWPRTHVTRYLTGVTLGLLTIKSAFLCVTAPLNIPPLPPGSPYGRLLALLATVGIASLFWRYVFGERSRNFYKVTR